MASVDIDRVIVRRAGWKKNRWRAVSIAANGEKVAYTQTYRDIRDAEAAAHTISEGAPVICEH